MSWLSAKLKYRIQFMKQEQEASSTGGFKQTYKALGITWAGIEPLSVSAASYVRNVQREDAPTHKFTVRKNKLVNVDIYGDGVVKANYYVFLLNTTIPMTGRLFKILTAMNVDEQDEQIQFLAKEMGLLDTLTGVIK